MSFDENLFPSIYSWKWFSLGPEVNQPTGSQQASHCYRCYELTYTASMKDLLRNLDSTTLRAAELVR